MFVSNVVQNNITFIVGRAITDVDKTDIIENVYIIIAYIVSPKKVSAYIDFIDAIFSLANVAKSLLKGVFTEQLSWQWWYAYILFELKFNWRSIFVFNFYINFSVDVFVLIIFFLHFIFQQLQNRRLQHEKKNLQMNFSDLVTFLSSIICLILALQRDDIIKPWNSIDVIDILIGCVFFLIVFIIIQYVQGDRAFLVERTLKMKNIFACCVYIFL